MEEDAEPAAEWPEVTSRMGVRVVGKKERW